MTDQPTPVLRIFKNQPVANSVEVAKFFGKRHDHVIRDIRKIMSNCPESFNAPNFGAVKYKDSKGELREAFYLTRDGFTLLAMGFTGSKAMRFKIAYIEAFNAMEAELTAKALPAPEAKPIDPPKPKRSPKPQALPAPDPVQAKIDILIGKVRFFTKEISEVERQIGDILRDEWFKSEHHEGGPYGPVGRVYVDLSCSHKTLWASLDFGLKAIEASAQAMLATARM